LGRATRTTVHCQHRRYQMAFRTLARSDRPPRNATSHRALPLSHWPRVKPQPAAHTPPLVQTNDVVEPDRDARVGQDAEVNVVDHDRIPDFPNALKGGSHARLRSRRCRIRGQRRSRTSMSTPALLRWRVSLVPRRSPAHGVARWKASRHRREPACVCVSPFTRHAQRTRSSAPEECRRASASSWFSWLQRRSTDRRSYLQARVEGMTRRMPPLRNITTATRCPA
jgi:hypothetical protein